MFMKNGPLYGKDVIIKFFKIPSDNYKGYPVITKNFNPFNPKTDYQLGSVVRIELADNDMNQIAIHDQDPRAIRTTLVGGNLCVTYDEDKEAFT